MITHSKEEFIREVEKTWPSHLNHFGEQLCDHFSGNGCKAPSADVHYEFCKDCPCTGKEAKLKPSILDHEDISGDNLLGG